MPSPHAKNSLLVRIAVMIIIGYRWFISPLLGVNCRFLPSCTDYAITALRQHGLYRGSQLTAARLMRCHPLPWGGHGYDPVPPKSIGGKP